MITIYSFTQDYLQQMFPRLKVTLQGWKNNCIFEINESQYIALFVVSESIEKSFSIDCVNIYFSQSIVSYLFSIDLKVWGYPTLLILWFINFKKANYLTFASSKSSVVVIFIKELFFSRFITNFVKVRWQTCLWKFVFNYKKWKRCFRKIAEILLSIYRQNLMMQNIRWS